MIKIIIRAITPLRSLDLIAGKIKANGSYVLLIKVLAPASHLILAQETVVITTRKKPARLIMGKDTSPEIRAARSTQNRLRKTLRRLKLKKISLGPKKARNQLK